MAGKSIVGAYNPVVNNFNVTTNNQTWFIAPVQATLASSTTYTEASTEVTVRKDATARNLTVRVNTNARTTNVTVRFRKNGADGNQNITIAGGATGWFQDTTNEDALVDGDTFCYRVQTLGSGGTIIISGIYNEFESDTGNAHTYMGKQDNAYNSTSNTTSYLSIGGVGTTTSATPSTMETNGTGVPCDGTLSNLQFRIITNTRIVDVPVTVYKNGAASALSVTVTAGATGFFEDASNTVSIAHGDFINLGVVPGAGGGSFTMRYFAVLFVGDADEAPLVGPEATNAVNGTIYAHPGAGDTSPSATESAVEMLIPFDCSVTGLRNSGNFGTGGGSATVRVNGVDTAVTASTASSGTHRIGDYVNEAAVVAGDYVSIKHTYVNTSNKHYNALAIRHAAAPGVAARRVAMAMAA